MPGVLARRQAMACSRPPEPITSSFMALFLNLPFAYLHHCRSQGMPSLLPSILVPGQCCRNQVASSQDVICEQCVRPSQVYVLLTGRSGLAVGRSLGTSDEYACSAVTCLLAC